MYNHCIYYSSACDVIDVVRRMCQGNFVMIREQKDKETGQDVAPKISNPTGSHPISLHHFPVAHQIMNLLNESIDAWTHWWSQSPHLSILLHCRSSLQHMSLESTFQTLPIVFPLVESYQGIGEGKLFNFGTTETGVVYLSWSALPLVGFLTIQLAFAVNCQ